MTIKLSTIAFDADDTLWENEQFFAASQERFARLLADFVDQDHLAERLIASERRNLGHYGYGVKGFVLSMIETAIDVTQAKVPAGVIQQLIETGQEMLRHPIELLPDVQATIELLANTHRILLITKGDLLDQERKLAQSGLGELFHGVEIVSDKTTSTYQDIFARHGDGAATSMMVGNSMRSDVVPALDAGSWGVHVPHSLTWALEQHTSPVNHPRYRKIKTLAQLVDLIADIDT